MSVFINQTLLTIRLDTGYDLASIATVAIRYKKPSGIVGEWPCTKDGNTVVYEVATSSDIDEVGTWEVQAKIDTATGKEALGEIFSFDISQKL